MTRAAVLTTVGAPLVVRDDVEVLPPGPGEVRVAVAASGVCHSDLTLREGVLPIPLPAVLGHEGSGIVEEMGPGVEGLAPGDHVVLSWVPQCGACYYCRRGAPWLCQQADAVLMTGGLLDGTPRLRLDGRDLFQMQGVGTFSETLVVPAISAVPVPHDLDLTIAALIGCAVLTGVGAALNTADIAPGDCVVVVGCGGVGLNIVQGARIAGAGEIVAVDVHASKLELAEALGATATVDSSRWDPASLVRTLTGERGADVAFDAVGRPETIHQTVDLTRRGGQAVLVGLPSLDVSLNLPAFLGVILAARTVKGCWYGSADTRRDIPRMVGLHRRGDLRLEELVTRRIGLEELDDAFAAMQAGEVARSVVEHPRPA